VLRVCSLGSGSGGNALVVEASDGWAVTRVLVDDGFNLRQLVRRLGRAGLGLRDLDAIVVTHEHSDHVGGVARLARRTGLAVYCSRGTADAAGLARPVVRVHAVEAGVNVGIGQLVIEPYSVPHDAAEPVQFVFGDGDRRVGLLTDAGESTSIIVAALDRVDALLLECNHDADLLRTGSYPPYLKSRIGSAHGHLSNAQAAGILSSIDRARLGWIAAAHLSKVNNTPSLARAALASVLGCAESEVAIADQDEGLGWRSV
jgi:phosphoribosyl 1,2-cyclic phosphodiesterase